MERPRFSDMLYYRRREMGVSTAQASHVLRLKEQVIIAFEEGDFENMPKSGYSQGMLSSYARYLGLNPSAVTEQFARDLSDWEGGNSPRYRDRGDDRANGASRANSGARGLLPTSGGYAGDMAGFSTVSDAHAHPGPGSSPLVSARDARMSVADGGIDPYGRAYNGQDRPYNARQPRSAGSGRAVRAQDRRAQGRDQVRFEDYGDSDAGAGRPQVRQRGGYQPRVPVGNRNVGSARVRGTVRSERDRVTNRGVSNDYVDDLRYDDQADPYEAASTHMGRVNSRNIAAPERPNVRRRQTGRKSDPRNRTQAAQRKPGLAGALERLFSDNQTATFVVLALLAIVIMVIVISSVGSCVSNALSTGRTNNVPVSQTQTEGSDDTTTNSYTPHPTDTTDSNEGSAGSAVTESTAPKKVEVTVAVAEGGVSWVEITVDGTSAVAETKTGPWSETYTVTDAIKIEASDPSVVTVTENGEKKTFDKKASGVGTLTIQGAPVEDTTSDSADSDTDTDTDSGTESTTTTTQHQAGDINDQGDPWDPDWNMWYSQANGDHYDDEGNRYTNWADAMASQQ